MARSFNLGFINTEKTWNLSGDGVGEASSVPMGSAESLQQERAISFVYVPM